jgi:hypothetical protein
MFDYQENTELTLVDSHNPADTEIPEPVEHWSLEDFADVLPAALY